MDPRPPTNGSRFHDVLKLVRSQGTRSSFEGELLRRLEQFHGEISGTPARVGGLSQALFELVGILRSLDREQQLLVRDFVLTENDWEMDWSYLRAELEEVLFQLATLLPFEEHLNGDSGSFVASLLQRLSILARED